MIEGIEEKSKCTSSWKEFFQIFILDLSLRREIIIIKKDK